jgi:hypothetical protein
MVGGPVILVPAAEEGEVACCLADEVGTALTDLPEDGLVRCNQCLDTPKVRNALKNWN